MNLVALVLALSISAHAESTFHRVDFTACVAKYEGTLKFRFSTTLQEYCGRFDDDQLDIAVALVAQNKLSPNQAISVIDGDDVKLNRCVLAKVHRAFASGPPPGQSVDAALELLARECTDQRDAAVAAGTQNHDANARLVINKINQSYFTSALAKWLGHRDPSTVVDLSVARHQPCLVAGALCVYRWVEDAAVEHGTRVVGQNAVLYDVSFRIGSRRVACIGSDYVHDRVFGLHACRVDGEPTALERAFGTLDYAFEDTLPDEFKRTMRAVKSTGGGDDVNRFDKSQSEYLLIGYFEL